MTRLKTLGFSSLCLMAVAICVPVALRAQSTADTAALARVAARVMAEKIPPRASDSVVIALPRTAWDSAVVRELRALRDWPAPADTLRAWHLGPAVLIFEGRERAIVRVALSRCEPEETRSIFNWWGSKTDYEYERVESPIEARWERVRGRGRVTVADGRCDRGAPAWPDA